MKRMIDDYIARFYDKEAKRTKALTANDFEMAKEIVEWKEKIAKAWDGVKVLEIESNDPGNLIAGAKTDTKVVLDTNGLGRDVAVEMVVYKIGNGEEKFKGTQEFKIVKEDGDIITYELSLPMKNAGVFRYGYRIYPKNAMLPHRQDFAYTRWI